MQRTVDWEALVQFQGSRYSVPPAYAGQTVAVAAEGGQIFIRTGDAIIAEHRQAAQPGQCHRSPQTQPPMCTSKPATT